MDRVEDGEGRLPPNVDDRDKDSLVVQRHEGEVEHLHGGPHEQGERPRRIELLLGPLKDTAGRAPRGGGVRVGEGGGKVFHLGPFSQIKWKPISEC